MSTSNDNSFFGYGAGRQTTGSANSFFGSGAGNSNTTGDKNTAIGYHASTDDAGAENTAVGYSSAAAGNGSVAMGSNAVAGGNSNVGIGAYSKAQGNNNTAIGTYARTVIGITNATAIGVGAVAISDNSIVLGGQNNTFVEANGALLVHGNISGLDVHGQNATFTITTSNIIKAGELKTGLRLGEANNNSVCINSDGFLAKCNTGIFSRPQEENSADLSNSLKTQNAQIAAQAAQIKAQQTLIEKQAEQFKQQQAEIDALKN